MDRMFGPMTKPFTELKGKHAGQPALVIGNSPNRIGFPLSALPWVSIGCNALYQEFVPDYLCVFDSTMIGKAVKDGAGRMTNLVLRASEARAHVLNAIDPEKRGSWYVWQDIPLVGLAGHMAIMLAGYMGCSPLLMVGFSCDMSNVYLNQECYESEQKVAKQSWKDKTDYMVPGSRNGDIGKLRDAFEKYVEMVPDGKVFWVGEAGWMLAAHVSYAREYARK
jgi:hypothetical protein